MIASPSPLQVQPLYQQHHDWLQGWLRARLGCPHNAAELAQDTFLRLLGKSEPMAVREPRAYLATIARGLVADFFRHRAHEQDWLETLATLPEAAHHSPEERALLLEALTAIDTLLDGFKPAVREAFLLSRLEGLTYPAIAERLGVTVRTVNNYMAQATAPCCGLAP